MYASIHFNRVYRTSFARIVLIQIYITANERGKFFDVNLNIIDL